MLSKEDIMSDDRFYIDEWNLNRLLERPVKRIKIKKIKVGNINRYLDLRITDLQDTDVYRYLNQTEEDKNQYEKYCSEYCSDNDSRGIKFYDKLIEEFDISNYDLKKGAICIDAYNSIIEGQHRSCIILKKYGESQVIDVVQFVFKQHEYKKFVKMIIYYTKKRINQIFRRK